MSTERPGGWVPGIGWVLRSCDLTAGDWRMIPGLPWPVRRSGVTRPTGTHRVVVRRWADGTVPEAPS